MKYQIEQYIAKYTLKTLKTDYSLFFTGVRSIIDAVESSIVFIDNNRKDINTLISKTKAILIIINNSDFINIDYIWLDKKVFILVDNSKEAIIKIASSFIKPPSFSNSNAIIHNEAQIDSSAIIGPNTYIGKSIIGANTVIYGNVYIYDNVIIGNNVIINAGSIIGADGFGYFENDELNIQNFPHIGGVVIGDNVEIGSNTCIDKGTLGDTVIESDVKIDNLVHIAHNVRVGKKSYIIANSMIGGSTSIGEENWIAPSACLRDGITTENNVTVGMASVLTKNIPEKEVWAGFPARRIDEFKSLLIAMKKLSKINDK